MPGIKDASGGYCPNLSSKTLPASPAWAGVTGDNFIYDLGNHKWTDNDADDVPLPSVPMVETGNGGIDWSVYGGADPDHWDVYLNGNKIATVAGVERFYLSYSGSWYVIGRSAAGAAVTQQSNTVII